MEYYIEISRLVDKALSGSRLDVVNQVTKLVDQLEKNGDFVAAQGFTKKLSKSGSNSINAQSVFQKPIPVEKDNRFALADKSMPTEASSKVFLSDRKTQDVDDFLGYIRKQDKLFELGIPSNPSLLLHGVPGTGKSQLASHIACKLNLPLITARSDALISSYLGSTSKNIRSLLEYANSEPCVLFLDEFDSIAKARDDKNEIGELKRVVVSLLQNIDSLENTVVIAATNHPHLLDPAVWRRFHYKMELGLPEPDVRYRIVENLLESFNVDNADISVLAKITSQMTGAEIEMVIHEYLRSIIVNELPYSLGALCRKILADKYPNLTFDSVNRKEELAWLHECDTNLYTYRLLALVFDISSSYVGKLLKGNK